MHFKHHGELDFRRLSSGHAGIYYRGRREGAQAATGRPRHRQRPYRRLSVRGDPAGRARTTWSTTSTWHRVSHRTCTAAARLHRVSLRISVTRGATRCTRCDERPTNGRLSHRGTRRRQLIDSHPQVRFASGGPQCWSAPMSRSIPPVEPHVDAAQPMTTIPPPSSTQVPRGTASRPPQGRRVLAAPARAGDEHAAQASAVVATASSPPRRRIDGKAPPCLDHARLDATPPEAAQARRRGLRRSAVALGARAGTRAGARPRLDAETVFSARPRPANPSLSPRAARMVGSLRQRVMVNSCWPRACARCPAFRRSSPRPAAAARTA